MIDKTAPVITDAGPTTRPNANGWYNANVTNGFSLRRRDLRPQRGLCPGLPGQRPVQDDEH